MTAKPRLTHEGAEILRVRELHKHFPVRHRSAKKADSVIRAVDGVSFSIHKGKTLGLVGESGSGKSTLGRTIARLLKPTSGSIYLEGRDITALQGHELREMRRDIQIVFQDPYSSLNPRMAVEDIVAEPLRVQGRPTNGRVEELLELVGISVSAKKKRPSEFSGGERQRIGIARALALQPKLLILDEPVSALDVSIQAQVLNLLMEIQERLGVAFLFISHDLSVVYHISHVVAVMHMGKLIETGPHDALYENPAHPYTEALLSAIPLAERGRNRSKRIVLEGDVPSPTNPPSGCRFRTRCFKAQADCALIDPPLESVEGRSHYAACLYPNISTQAPLVIEE